jgi:threonyl-tRNA synthetase
MSNIGLNREEINARIAKRQILLAADGSEYSVDNKAQREEVCGKHEVLKKYVEEETGLHAPGEMPPSIKAMQRLELVDYEPASDSGHFRFYPKGSLIFDLVKDWADEIALNRLNAMKIETPLLYSYEEPDIRQQVESFHERHYVVNSSDREKEFILRFAGDFGLFRMMRDAGISYRQLPLRMYEYSKSFRYEKSGELTGLKRLRAFSMPDIHSFTKDLDEGFREYKEIYRKYFDLARAMEIKFVVAFRAEEDFYYRHKAEILELVEYSGMPVFIELLSEMKHYWAIKCEFQAVDCNDSFTQLSTVQLDVKDAEIYGIRYVDRDGDKKGCTICHSSIGSIERWIYAILEAALMKEKPELPYWLSPVQLRLIPVSEEFNDSCEVLACKLVHSSIRVDIDDSGERLGKKIRNAEQEWIPFTMVVGWKELEKNLYPLRKRNGEESSNLSIEDISAILDGLQREMPFRSFNMNIFRSRQPVFK